MGFARYEEAMRDYVAGYRKSGEGVGRWVVPENRFIAWLMNQNHRLLPYVPWKGLIRQERPEDGERHRPARHEPLPGGDH